MKTTISIKSLNTIAEALVSHDNNYRAKVSYLIKRLVKDIQQVEDREEQINI